jgi:hypothetical protein
MVKSLAVALSLSLAAGVVAHAQTVRRPVAPEPLVTGPQADMMKLQMAMVSAQQAAIKPGDEAMPCEALQKELVSTMTDPAIQAYAAKADAAYAKQLASQPKGVMTAEAAAALAAALTSGTAMTGMPTMPSFTPGQAMTPQQMQQLMLAQQQATITYMNQLMPLMPALMRSQRVAQLAAVKNCAWMTGGLGLYPGAGVPTNPAIPAGLPKR